MARPAYLIAPVLACVFAFVLATSSGLVAVKDLNDLFVTFDAMWRAALGQAPHVDFPSPIGQAYYAVFRLAEQLSPLSPGTLLTANAGMSVAVAAASWLLLRRRMSPLYFTLAVLTAAGVVLSPRDHDGWVTSLSFVAPYNTWAWGLVTPLALAALLPPRTPNRALDLMDAAVLGLILAFLLYLKLTFFLPALGLVLFGAIPPLRHLPQRTVLLALAVLGACILGVELTAHNNAAYLADLGAASAVNLTGSRAARLLMLIKHVGVGVAFGAIFVAALRLVAPAEPWPAWARTAWRPVLVAAALLAVGAVIATENHPEWLNTFCFVGLIGGADLAGRRAAVFVRPLGDFGRLARGSALVLAAICGLRPLLDDGAVVAHAVMSRQPDVVAFPSLGPANSGLRMARALVDPAESGVGDIPLAVDGEDWRPMVAGDAVRVVEGMRLLARHDPARQVIFAADFSNPYPTLFRSRPPPKALIWWDPGRSYNWTVHPGDEMLCNVTIVMKRRDPYYRTAWIWAVYGPAIERDFRPVESSPNWELWARAKACGPA